MTDYPPALTLSAAKINLLHMSGYASTMLMMVNLGIQRAMTEDGFFRQGFLDLDPGLQDENLAELECLMSDITEEHAINGANAAALIFVHAGLDSCLQQLLKLTAEIDGERWKTVIPEKKVSLADVHQRGVDSIVQERIAIHLETIRRESLLAKCILLLRILQPTTGNCSGFVYDSARVKRIESLRNDCAHGRVGLVDFSQIEGDLQYLREVGMYFIDSVGSRYHAELTHTESTTA